MVCEYGSKVAIVSGEPGGLELHPRPLPMPASSNGEVVVADTDGDRVPDLVIGPRFNLSSDQVLRVFPGGRGPGRLIRPARLPGGDGIGYLAAADFTGDGHDDIAVSIERIGGRQDPVALLLLPGSATGLGPARFLDPAEFPLVTGDFNGDGHADLVAREHSQNHGPFRLQVYLGTRGGLTAPRLTGPRLRRSQHWGARMVTGNFDGDDFADVGPSGEDGKTILKGSRDGLRSGIHWSEPDDVLSPPLMSACDQNGDGRTDLVVNSFAKSDYTRDELQVFEDPPERWEVLQVLPGDASGISRAPGETLTGHDFKIPYFREGFDHVVC